MRNLMESITYMVTALAVASLMVSLHTYWIGMGIYLYLLIFLISVLFLAFYIERLSKKDQHWWIKMMYISVAPMLLSAIFFRGILEIILVTLMSTVAGFSTYYNYYRMADYIREFRGGRDRFMDPMRFSHLETPKIISLDEYVEKAGTDLFSALKRISADMDGGKVEVHSDGKTIFIKEVKK